MPRTGDDARNRLQHSALTLFAEHGFDQTTAAQIAAHAGVTERTFFRHFPDKREVLFEGQGVLSAALTQAIEEAPPGLSPIEVLRLAFDAVTPLLENNRPFSEPRQRIIASNPALQEREVAKHAILIKVVADALRARGVRPLQADLAAQTGLAVLSHALVAWFAGASQPLDTFVAQAFAELHHLALAAKP